MTCSPVAPRTPLRYRPTMHKPIIEIIATLTWTIVALPAVVLVMFAGLAYAQPNGPENYQVWLAIVSSVSYFPATLISIGGGWKVWKSHPERLKTRLVFAAIPLLSLLGFAVFLMLFEGQLVRK